MSDKKMKNCDWCLGGVDGLTIKKVGHEQKVVCKNCGCSGPLAYHKPGAIRFWNQLQNRAGAGHDEEIISKKILPGE